MSHNAWLILKGSKDESDEFIMKNSSRNKLFSRGSTDNFTLVSRNLGKLKRCTVGAFERDGERSSDDRVQQWHCYQVAVTDSHTGDKWVAFV